MESLDDQIQYDNDLKVTTPLKRHFNDMAYWGKFLSIISMAIIGLVILALIIAMIFGGSAMSQLMSSPFSGIGFVIYMMFMIGIMGFGFYISYLLYTFSVATKRALISNNQSELEEGFNNLRRVFKIYGIFTAIVAGIYAIMLVFVLIGGAFAAMG